MSLIDLSKIDAVAAAFNTFMHDVADLVQDPGAEAEETESESEDEQTELHNETDGSPYQLLGVWDGNTVSDYQVK